MHRIVFVGCVAVFLSACSSSSTTGTGTATPGTDAGGSTTADSGSGASTPLNGCTTYTDKTAGGATITWDLAAIPPSTCLHVKKGGTVTFNGTFATHPLGAKGGEATTPFSTAPTGTTATFTFPAVGTYGFTCGIHTTMTGAIQVTE